MSVEAYFKHILTSAKTLIYLPVNNQTQERVVWWANNICPRRVLAQTAKTRGTLEAPAYREENFAVPEKISLLENTVR